MTKDEALKMALEALEGFYEYGYDRRECFEHITAIKEALAQPEQELDYKAIGQQAYESGYSTGYMDCAVKMKAQPEPPPECQTEAEKTAFAFGWFKAMESQRKPQYDKTEMNCFVQDLYDKKMQEGKRGHYETMFHVVHRAIEAAHGIRPMDFKENNNG